ncbi:MAG: hypothetical protein APG12_00823 [Candidatus Methanofastidiosum methylothiophilum]|uniref:Uncharacterized protein n=1 Tax=Candidatus Methanofastidiosum methylothiophilum TaxID=1705564 RepID=A0A150IK40_9EURY|nr:MAG: hypothetical protein APG10_00935 [Candidatus Methanofastidiosum methylthiophilus]KYC47495.1 MAG: hypothetical protein APG11_01095 [Candidatus Methanofastidiosum methylthiophilus]KYC50395.1 MAG: hypothetical protein APG12_00823 [Candidatus Methanofastidiosum methylthiophilus]
MRLNEMNSFVSAIVLALSYFVFSMFINFFLLKNNNYKIPIIGAITFSIAYLAMQKILRYRIENKIKK